MSGTFVTAPKHVQTTFEKKYLETVGNRQERRVDLPGLSPQLISKKNELELIQQKLNETREEQEKWNLDYEQRKARIAEKKIQFEVESPNQLEIRKRLQLDVDKLVEAHKKQVILTKNLSIELEQLNHEKIELAAKIDSYQGKIGSLQQCADFFEEIVDQTHHFENAETILHRYHTLISNRDEYTKDLHNEIRKEPKTDLLKQELEQLQNQRIEMNHTISNIRDEITKIIKQNRFIQANAIKDIERLNDKEAEYATINSTIDNITERVISIQSKLGKIWGFQEQPVTVEQKLDLIEQRFLDLMAIVTPSEYDKKDAPVKHPKKTVVPAARPQTAAPATSFSPNTTEISFSSILSSPKTQSPATSRRTTGPNSRRMSSVILEDD